MATLIRSARISSERCVLNGGNEALSMTHQVADVTDVQTVVTSAQSSGIDNDEPAKLSVLEIELSQAQNHAAETEAELRLLRHELDQVRDTAVQQGYKEGHEEGTEAGNKELANRLDALDQLLKQISENYADDIAGREASVVEVVFAATTKILGTELVKAEGVVAVVRQVIKQVARSNKLIVHLSHKDKNLLVEAQNISRRETFDEEVEIIADDHVTSGGCILETGSGSLDARIEVQLQNMRECLMQVASQRKTEGSRDG